MAVEPSCRHDNAGAEPVIFSILDRYIGRSILWTSLLVLLVLVTLASIFAFISELDDVGTGSYGVLQAAQYVLLTSPGKAYLLFAPSVLLGSLLGLGALASNSELTVMRAAGISNARIIRAVLLTGVALMLLITLIGETVMPRAEQMAENLRLTALEERLSVKGHSGLWFKSGERYVSIATVMPDFTLLDIDIHSYRNVELIESTHVARALPLVNEDWQLLDVQTSRMAADGIDVQRRAEQRWSELALAIGGDAGDRRLVSADVLKSLSVSPDSLSVMNLLQQVSYLRDNQLDSSRVELALWVKITSPLATIVMLMLSLPFVFASQRAGGAGQKIFIGIMLGIVYVLLNKLLTQLALANGLPPAASAILPLLLFLTVAVIGIRRTA